MAVFLQVINENNPAEARRFFLPPGHVEPLIHCDSLNYLAPLAQLLAGAVHPLPDILDAYRNGGGVPFSAYGADLREGQAAINYPAFAHQLASQWLPTMPDIHNRLLSEPPAWVVDIGRGFGWSSIAIAKRYPRVHVNGFDLDAPFIERARLNAERNRVADRATFQWKCCQSITISSAFTG